MQNLSKLVFWGLGIVFLVSGVSAFTVTGVTINPPGTLEPGDAVNVSYTVYAASGTAFPSYDDLQFISGLDDTAWSYSIVVNGVENTRPAVGGRTVTISGFELAYRNQDEVLVKVSTRGRIPPASAPGSIKNLVTIQEIDSRGYTINSTIVTVSHLIGTPTPTPTPSVGSISVTSSPSGANIYLDNVYKGLSPLIIDAVPNGNHVIVLRLDGYEDSFPYHQYQRKFTDSHYPTQSPPRPDTHSNIHPSANSCRDDTTWTDNPDSFRGIRSPVDNDIAPRCNGIY